MAHRVNLVTGDIIDTANSISFTYRSDATRVGNRIRDLNSMAEMYKQKAKDYERIYSELKAYEVPVPSMNAVMLRVGQYIHKGQVVAVSHNGKPVILAPRSGIVEITTDSVIIWTVIGG